MDDPPAAIVIAPVCATPPVADCKVVMVSVST